MSGDVHIFQTEETATAKPYGRSNLGIFKKQQGQYDQRTGNKG